MRWPKGGGGLSLDSRICGQRVREWNQAGQRPGNCMDADSLATVLEETTQTRSSQLSLRKRRPSLLFHLNIIKSSVVVAQKARAHSAVPALKSRNFHSSTVNSGLQCASHLQAETPVHSCQSQRNACDNSHWSKILVLASKIGK